MSKSRTNQRRLAALTAPVALCAALSLGACLVIAVPDAGATTVPSPTMPLTDQQAGAVAKTILGPLHKVSGSTTRGISDKTITIAGISTETQGGAPALQGGCAGTKARFARADRQGGVRGYKINYLGCSDDGGSAQTADQLIHKAVQQQNAFAIVPLSSVVSSAADGEFLNASHELYFGTGLTPTYCGWNTAPFAFSSMESVGCTVNSNKQFLSSFTISIYNSYKAQKNVKPSSIKWALVSSNLPNDHAISNAQAAIAKTLGNKVTYNAWPEPAPGSPPVTDWGPVAEQIIQSGANAVELELVGQPAFELMGALKANGYQGDIEGVGFNAPGVLSVASLRSVVDGTLGEDSWTGSTVYPSPQMTQVQKDLTAIRSRLSPDNFPVLWGYQAADFFLQALAKTTGTLTEEKVANLINGGFTYTGYGTATGPSVWPQGHVTQSNFAGMELVNGKTGTTKAVIPLKQYGANYLVNTSS
jgi:branched-chain amino acid transport system substrate-binding protein